MALGLKRSQSIPMPNKGRDFLLFCILQETASILRMNITVILFMPVCRRKEGLQKSNDSGTDIATKEEGDSMSIKELRNL